MKLFIKHKQLNYFQGLFFLGIIWLLGVVCDRIWFNLDNSVPAWDQADYLNGAMNYWQALQTPQWSNGEWWRSFWLLSSKIPPLSYILTVPWLNIFGTSPDAATLVMLPLSAILLVSVYSLGVVLFSVSVGLWAAGLCQLFPGLYYFRLEFLLDYPLTAFVTLSFFLLTLFWKIEDRRQKAEGRGQKERQKAEGRGQKEEDKMTSWAQVPSRPYTSPSSHTPHTPHTPHTLLPWIKAALFGISFGLALMVKQTALFFLLLPILWVLGGSIIRRQWARLTQLIMGLCLSVVVFYPWYRTNWLLILTSGKRATVDSAIAEGDPSLNTLDAWTFYGKHLPDLLSYPLLLVPIVGFLMSWIYWYRNRKHSESDFKKNRILDSKWTWLAVFLIGGYFLSSLNINKDVRYVLPLLPVLSIVLAAGLLSWQGRWKNQIRWGTVGFAVVLMGLNLFPLGGTAITQLFSPSFQKYVYLGQQFPHEEVIQEIIATSPYLKSNLGVLPSTPEINQHNFSYYGKRAKSQVAARQVGVREKEVEQDVRSLDWFLTKTGEQGSVPEAQANTVKKVEEGIDFQQQKSWQLPDKTTLKLYHRIQPKIDVQPIAEPRNQVQLERVTVRDQVPPGFPVPVIYEWSGPWEQLQSGIVLLTWQREKSCRDANNSCPFSNKAKDFHNSSWLHDHGIGMGELHSGRLQSNQLQDSFRVIEQTAMFPDADLEPGNYTLQAIYLNRETGESYPIAVPPIALTLDANATPVPAPELDLVTQLRILAPGLSGGIKGLDPIFVQIARINQYDPTQDYLVQADQALSYRLKQENNNKAQSLNWIYAIALARALQQDIEGAIAAFQQAIELNPESPYPSAYLAFIYLYDFRPQAAQEALQPAVKINPKLPEVEALSGIIALMKGNFWQAWHQLKPIISNQ